MALASLYAALSGEFLSISLQRDHHLGARNPPQKQALDLAQHGVDVWLPLLTHQLAGDAIEAAGDERGRRFEIDLRAVQADIHAMLQ
jgi:hypothetical protein